MLDEIARSQKPEVKVSDLADLVKSEYFRLDDSELSALDELFEEKYGALITTSENANGSAAAGDRRGGFKYALGVGRWDVDSLENTVAFVGGALSMSAWLERARKLLSNWPQVKATSDLVAPKTGDVDNDGARDEETERIGNVNVFNLQRRPKKNERSKLSFLVPLVRFLCASSAWIVKEHARKPYDLLHIHNVPDFLVFAAVWPRITGAKVILDIHDIVPEFYASKFRVPESSLPILMLKSVERASASMADRVIVSNHLWLDKFAKRTGANGKCTVFINNVDGAIFFPRPRVRNDDKFIVIFPGGLQWHQGLDIAIRAFEQVSQVVPRAEFHIYGDGNMKEKLVTLTRELGLEEKVRFYEPLPVRKIAEIMAEADLGVVPKRADSFGNEAYSTKIMEFMSIGVPVVVSNTKIDQFYFNSSVVRFFESGNPEALAAGILDVMQNVELRRQMIQRGLEYARENSWEPRKRDYLSLVDGLLDEEAGGTDGDVGEQLADFKKGVLPDLEKMVCNATNRAMAGASAHAT